MYRLRIKHPYYTRLNRVMLFETREEAIEEIRRRLAIDADDSDTVFYHSDEEKDELLSQALDCPDDDYILEECREFAQHFKGNGYYDVNWNSILLDDKDPDHVCYNDYDFTIEEVNDDEADDEEADEPYECRLLKSVTPIKPND